MKKWIFLIHSLLVLETGSSGVAKRCDYKKCADRHLSSRKRKNCNSYQHYATCMAKYEMVCRGDMAYHSNIKVVNLKLNLMKCDKKSRDRQESRERQSNGKKSRSRDSKSRRKSSSHNRDELDYADPTNSAGSSSSASSAAFPDIISKGMGTTLDSGNAFVPRKNDYRRPMTNDYQADDPNRSNLCTFESENSQNERSLCAVIGSANSFRIKNWMGMPHTSCPVTDGAHQIFAIPHVLVMGTFHSQRLTKVTVIIRRAGRCADYKTWQGEVDAIHPTFSDGTNQSGIFNSATITALDPKAIQIHLKYLNIKITIRQIIGGDWLQFTAIMPPNLIPMDSEQQLCSTACTDNTIFHQRKNVTQQNSDTSISDKVTSDNENIDCDTFWCRNILSAWGERGAADARSLDPENWNRFNQKSSSQVPKLLNSMLLTISLLYLTVL